MTYKWFVKYFNLMPEGEVPPEEQAAIYPQTEEEALTERLALADERLGRLFDRAIQEGKDPVQLFIQESNIPRLERIFPSPEIQRVLDAIRVVPADADRSVFIEQARRSVEPLIRAELFDPEIRRRVEAMNEDEKIKFSDPETGKSLVCTFRQSAQEITFANKERILPTDKVLEVSWSEDLMGPTGVRVLKRIFHEIAKHLQGHEEIKAITGVSWMMNHPVVQRFGFEVFPEIEFPTNQKIGSAKMGNAARQGKPYGDNITPDEVLYGAIPRDTFIQRFGYIVEST